MDAALFPADRLSQFALEMCFGADRCAAALATLSALLARRADGCMAALCEMRVEQSFNERLFSELFGYQTLLRSGRGAYHLRPKHWHAEGRYDDFSLGFFGPTGGTPLVSCELKTPGVDLDAPQRGRSYAGMTPVQQAMGAVENTPSVKWVLLANFDEIRLYRAGDSRRFHSIRLSDLLTPWDMEKALAVFSRETLLGDGVRRAPLERLFVGEVPSMLTNREGSARLVHRIMPEQPQRTELRLHALDDALQAGLKSEEGLAGIWVRELAPVLKGDRLVAEMPGSSGVYKMLELTTSGVLTFSEYLATWVDPKRLTIHLGSFIRFAAGVAGVLEISGNYLATWSLLDLTNSTCKAEAGWASPPGEYDFTITEGVEEARVPPTLFDPNRILDVTWEAVRDLLYPYEGRDPWNPKGSRIARLRPSRDQVKEILVSSSIKVT